MQEAKQLMGVYYTHVGIKKTRGFSAEPNREGDIPGADTSYEHPGAVVEIQKAILLKNNELIKAGLMDEFRMWLRKYERGLMNA